MHIGDGEEALGMKSVGSTIGFVTIAEDDSVSMKESFVPLEVLVQPSPKVKQFNFLSINVSDRPP